MELTGMERVSGILERKPVDRIAVFEAFWPDTRKKWFREGHLSSEDENFSEHFNFDIEHAWTFKYVADMEYENEVIEEDDETILMRDGNGATLRRHKKHSSTPEHVDFSVRERKDWEEKIKPLLTPSEKRIDAEKYREGRERAGETEKFFTFGTPNVFELMHPVCGHEYMLMGMAIDPDWVRDMVDTYSSLIISLMEILFEKEGKPDGIWFFEDMGFKNRPFMSPQMYREIVMPGHKKTFDFAHSLGLPVIVHSCGFVEPLVPYMIEAGMDCLQAMENKAGMDVFRLKREFGDDIVLFGGMDARNLVANDTAAILKELKEKIPFLKKDYGYILHSDHSIPDTCEYETYRFFMEEGLKLGRYQ